MASLTAAGKAPVVYEREGGYGGGDNKATPSRIAARLGQTYLGTGAVVRRGVLVVGLIIVMLLIVAYAPAKPHTPRQANAQH